MLAPAQMPGTLVELLRVQTLVRLLLLIGRSKVWTLTHPAM